ncbi:hypothetical protein BH10ACT1_BH10ACT1_03690 [soil metagenome]
MTSAAIAPTSTTTTVGGLPARSAGPPGHPIRESVVYLVPIYVIGIVMALLIPGTYENPGPVAFIALITPAVVVGCIRLMARLRHAPANRYPIGLRRTGLRFWPAAFVISAAVIWTSVALAWAVGVVGFDDLPSYLEVAPINLVLMSVLVLGEEIGWRSYLLPRLGSVMSIRRAAMATGFFQACFHLPLLLLTRSYDGLGSRWLVVPGMMIVVTAAGALFGWLRVRSESLWPAAIAHATVNTCMVEAPTLLDRHGDMTAYLTGEGGLFTAVLTVVAAVIILRRANWTPRSQAPPAEAVTLDTPTVMLPRPVTP